MKNYLLLLYLIGTCIASRAQTTRRALYDTIAIKMCICYSQFPETANASVGYAECLSKQMHDFKNMFTVFKLDVDNDSISLIVKRGVLERFFFNCKKFTEDDEKESHGVSRAGKIFKGTFVSQRKLESGDYEIILRSEAGHRIFLSTTPIDERRFQPYINGYQLTIGFEIVKEKKSGKLVFRLPANAPISIVGAIQVK